MATFPKLAMLISRVGSSATYGLLLVVQLISELDCEVTVQARLSILTSVVSLAENPVPVKVSESPPRTVPNRLFILVKTGVFAWSKVTSSKSVSVLSKISFGVH